MKTAESQIEQNLSFWPLVGPIMLFASLTLLFLNFPEKALIFAAIVVLSLAVSWHFTWRGVALSIALLSLGFAYHYDSMDSGEMYWHLGMSGALTLGFVATALASEETAERLKGLFRSEPTTDQAIQEQLKRQNSILADQNKQLEAHLQDSREAFAQLSDKKISLDQLLETARQELKALTAEQELLQLEMSQRKESLARTQQQMAEAKEEARFLSEEMHKAKSHFQLEIEKVKKESKIIHAENEKLNLELRGSKAQLEGQTRRASFLEEEKQAIQREWQKEAAETKQQLASLEEKWQQSQLVISQLATQAELLRKERDETVQKWEQLNSRTALLQSARDVAITELGDISEKIALLLKERDSAVSELQLLQEQHRALDQMESNATTSAVQVTLLQQNMLVAEAQKLAHWRAMRTAEGKANQLREQFEAKDKELKVARRQRFVAEEQTEQFKRNLEEWGVSGIYQEVKPLLKHIIAQERSYHSALKGCQKDVESLETLISYLIENQRLM